MSHVTSTIHKNIIFLKLRKYMCMLILCHCHYINIV